MWFRVMMMKRQRTVSNSPALGALGAFLIVTSIGLLAAALLLQIVDSRLKPTILAVAEARARVAATEAINEAISSKVAESIKYEDLMAIRTDNRGKVALVQPNTGEINRLASITAMEVQKTLKGLTQQRFEIPLGQVLNSQAFASVGPRIPVTVVPIGSVSANVTDEFQQAGINQTRHRIYLMVNTIIKIVIPLVSASVEVSARVPLTEAVIMGEVPQVYFGMDGKGLNLNSKDHK